MTKIPSKLFRHSFVGMEDDLSALRSAIGRGEHITVDDAHIILGDSARLKRKAATNFRSMRGRGEPYSLETVYFQFKHHLLPYNDYVKRCAQEKVPHVTVVDKKDLIAYLKGDISECPGLLGKTEPSGAKENSKRLSKSTTSSDQGSNSASLLGKKRSRTGSLGASGEDAPFDAREKPDDIEALHRRERDQRTMESVMSVEGWDFSNLREKLTKCMDTMRASGVAGKRDNSVSAEGNRASSRSRDAKSYDPRGDRYTTSDDRFWRENMGSDFYEMGIDPSGSFKSSNAAKSTEKTSGAEAANKEASQLPSSAKTSQPAAKRSRFAAKGQIPIIIVPSTTLSMLTIQNAQEFFENGSFLTIKELRARGSLQTAATSKLVITRRPGGTASSARYEIISNPLKLTSTEWTRVVAVVCTGQTWQFKNWPSWENDKTKKTDNGLSDIFRTVCGFLFHYDDTPPPAHTKNWPIKFLALSRNRRHNDIRAQTKFWESVDAFCRLHKKNVLY